MNKKTETMRIRAEVMQKIQKYNKWVDEVRENAEKWRPRLPQHGKNKPFINSNAYLLTSDKDYEKYPELNRIEQEAEKQPEIEEYFGKYYKPK